jgi:aldehyde:ferredoxin oxidoreductase
MYGWMGRRLRIDLSRATFDIETLSPDYCRRWIGGRGFNADVLYRETGPDLSAFAPENPICFAAGVLTGTLAPASGLAYVAARSPQSCSLIGPDVTGIGTGAVGGGSGPMMKYAGYDQIVVTGRAAAPVYVLVNGETVEFREAAHLWGLGTRMAAIRILEELGSPEVGLALIGPAGEHRVRIAGVVGAGHLAVESGGAGAVMGSKHLKALAVLGNKPVAIAQPKAFMADCWKARENLQRFCLSDGQHDSGQGSFDKNRWKGGVLSRKNACWSCPAGCEGVAKIKEGPFVGFQGLAPAPQKITRDGAPDVFENVAVFAVVHDALRDLGMDAVSAGAAVCWLWSAYEKGIVTEDDIGCSLSDPKDPRTNLELLHRIGFRQALGDALADGVNLHVCAASRGLPAKVLLDCSGLPADCHDKNRPSFKEPARVGCAADLAGMCAHDFLYAGRPEVLEQTVVQFLRRCTGVDFDADEINAAAERTRSLERAIWLRQGSARQDDSEVVRHWGMTFVVKNHPLTAEYSAPDESVQKLYYVTEGWDAEGFISPRKASELAVPEIVPDMEAGRKLYQKWLAQRGCGETD